MQKHVRLTTLALIRARYKAYDRMRLYATIPLIARFVSSDHVLTAKKTHQKSAWQ